jgi:hypothetical protein
MEISLPIVEFNKPDMEGNKKMKNEEKKSASTCDVDVQQCIDSYLRPESLDGDNQYECSRCVFFGLPSIALSTAYSIFSLLIIL